MIVAQIRHLNAGCDEHRESIQIAIEREGLVQGPPGSGGGALEIDDGEVVLEEDILQPGEGMAVALGAEGLDVVGIQVGVADSGDHDPTLRG